jgi:hypothetical protein
VSAFSIVEAFDVSEHVSLGFVTHLSEEKKLSIAALSQTLPERLIEQMTP